MFEGHFGFSLLEIARASPFHCVRVPVSSARPLRQRGVGGVGRGPFHATLARWYRQGPCCCPSIFSSILPAFVHFGPALLRASLLRSSCCCFKETSSSFLCLSFLPSRAPGPSITFLRVFFSALAYRDMLRTTLIPACSGLGDVSDLFC